VVDKYKKEINEMASVVSKFIDGF